MRWSVSPNTYYDSVQLMRVSEALGREPGVLRAAAVMATPLNLDLLRDDGLLPDDIRPSSDDLVVAVLAEDDDAAERALGRLTDLLHVRHTADEGARETPARTLESAASRAGSNIAIIGVPGQFAAAEAYAALRAGLHVFLFSDNVSVAHEVALKALAEQQGLLMMGPDCGTAIIDGVGLGFTNRVQPGPVGIVGASGTGIQQVCCLLDDVGIGISAAIGTGGRDLSAQVGGSMTRRGVRLLAEDDSVEVIAVISKPPSRKAADALHRDLRQLAKPAVVCLLGASRAGTDTVRYAGTLSETASLIGEMLGVAAGNGAQPTPAPAEALPQSGRVYGLYAGGTLCDEAGRVLDGMGVRHHLVDLGDDRYTRGRAHPIIDPRLRASMLADLGGRQDTGAVLIDVILGDLAHPDPAGSLLPAIEDLRVRSDRPPQIVATLVGTRADPQGLERQRAVLEQAGIAVFAANTEAARFAGQVAGSAA